MNPKGSSSKLADRPATEDGRQFHLKTLPTDLAPNCIVAGSPERVRQIAGRYLTEVHRFDNPRAIVAFTGFYRDMPMSVVTHGMGGPFSEIVLTEAHNSGAERFLRVGSCGAIQPDVNVGDIVVVSGAVRYDGTSDSLAMSEFPASASPHMVIELESVAKDMRIPHHVGYTATTSSFREGQARPGNDNDDFVPPHILARHEWLTRLPQVKAYEMECATHFVWGASRRRPLMMGAVTAVFANRVTKELQDGAGETAAIEVALEAMRNIQRKYPL